MKLGNLIALVIIILVLLFLFKRDWFNGLIDFVKNLIGSITK